MLFFMRKMTPGIHTEALTLLFIPSSRRESEIFPQKTELSVIVTPIHYYLLSAM